MEFKNTRCSVYFNCFIRAAVPWDRVPEQQLGYRISGYVGRCAQAIALLQELQSHGTVCPSNSWVIGAAVTWDGVPGAIDTPSRHHFVSALLLSIFRLLCLASSVLFHSCSFHVHALRETPVHVFEILYSHTIGRPTFRQSIGTSLSRAAVLLLFLFASVQHLRDNYCLGLRCLCQKQL